MTRVNLLPPEIRQRQRTRRRTALAAFAGVVLVAVLVFIYFLQGVQLSRVQDDLAAQQARNAELQTRAAKLQRFETLRADLEQRRTLIQNALTNEVRWSGILRDVSVILPARMWLTSMTGTVTAAVAAGTTTPQTTTPATGTPLVGSIQFQGESLDEPTVSLWLTRLEQVHGWVNAWLSSADKNALGATDVVTFTSSVDLSTDATHGGST
jgi:Tfp pilus assembly protein PilN